MNIINQYTVAPTLKRLRFGLSVITLSCFTGCVAVPTVSESYDKKCQIVRKKVELTIEQVQAFKQLNCGSSHDCKSQFLGQVIGATLIFPVSVVISGSIAVVGNTMIG